MSSRNVVVGLAALLLVPFGTSVVAEETGPHWSCKGATGPTD